MSDNIKVCRTCKWHKIIWFIFDTCKHPKVIDKITGGAKDCGTIREWGPCGGDGSLYEIKEQK